jgi:tetratricopeptide (TPR) repeat protein
MTDLTADQLFNAAAAASRANDAAETEAKLRQCLTRDPHHILALLNLGVLLTNKGQLPEAQQLLLRAAQIHPSADTIHALASLYEKAGHFDEAAKHLRVFLAGNPNDVGTLKRLAVLSDRMSDDFAKNEYYRRAWEAAPADIDAGVGYVDSSFDDNPAIAGEVMEKLLAAHAHDNGALTAIYARLLYFNEFYERIKRGLMPYHATALDELFFKYSSAHFENFRELQVKRAETEPLTANMLLGRLTTLFCSRDRAGAQRCLDALAPAIQNNPWEVVTFDPAFYANLETQSDDDLFGTLAPIVPVLSPAFTGEHVTYLACNHAYFERFATMLMRSFAATTPGGQLHMHIMDATEAQIADAAAFCRSIDTVTIALSVENPGVDALGLVAARSYYHAVRFIRFYQHVKQYGRTLWMMDVDALFNRDARELYQVLGDKDCAFRIRAGRLEPWNQFSAAVIGATGRPRSVGYFRLVAAYIAHFQKQDKLRWGIDQLAMYGAFEYLNDFGRAPSVSFLNDRIMDQTYLPEGIVWFTAGKKKFTRPAGGSDTLTEAERRQLKYWQLFDRYAGPLNSAP